MNERGLPYGSQKYWENRYNKEKAQDTTFDWYPGADEILCEEMVKYLPPDKGTRVLEIGSGSSQLAYKLCCQLSYRVVATDICLNVIHNIQEKWKGSLAKGAIEFMCVDCCKLPLACQSLRSVVDKGTLDAVDCTDDRATGKCLEEVHRVLLDAGFYFLVSCREPKTRREDVSHLFDIVSIVEIRSAANKSCPCPDAYLYILQKKPSVI